MGLFSKKKKTETGSGDAADLSAAPAPTTAPVPAAPPAPAPAPLAAPPAPPKAAKKSKKGASASGSATGTEADVLIHRHVGKVVASTAHNSFPASASDSALLKSVQRKAAAKVAA